MKKNKASDFFTSMCVVLLPIISYIILGPLEIYCGNRKDFAFKMSDFLFYFILIGVIICVGYSLLLMFLPKKVQGIINTLIFCFGFLSYIENMFLNTKLSDVNGNPMDWSTIGAYFYVNAVIWGVVLVLIIAASILLKKYWEKIIRYGALFLVAIQLIAAVSLIVPVAVSSEDKSGLLDLNMSGENQFTVGGDTNIIIFVLDTLGTTQLNEALTEYPDILEGFEDFTFYTNADCHYYCTFPSMTHILTGVEFDFDSESGEWLDNAWSSDRANDFYDELHKLGYTAELFSSDVKYQYGSYDNLYGKFDNIVYSETEVNNKELLYLLGKLSAYRYLPYVLKPYFEVLTLEFSDVVSIIGTENVCEDNSSYYSILSEKGLTVSNKNDRMFIIEHLFGTHQPYTTDADGSYVEESTVNATVAGCFNIVKSYIAELKRLNVYDNSVIIVTADHGSWFGCDPQPIYGVKLAGTIQQNITYNNSPISHDDFQATILDILGEDYSKYGTSIYDWNENDRRERTVYMRMTDEQYPDVQGSSFNVYYGYNYSTDINELNNTVADGPDIIVPATPWK